MLKSDPCGRIDRRTVTYEVLERWKLPRELQALVRELETASDAEATMHEKMQG